MDFFNVPTLTFGVVPTENSILLKKRKRQARGNEIGWALTLLCSHGWIHELSADRDEAQIDCALNRTY